MHIALELELQTYQRQTNVLKPSYRLPNNTFNYIPIALRRCQSTPHSASNRVDSTDMVQVSTCPGQQPIPRTHGTSTASPHNYYHPPLTSLPLQPIQGLRSVIHPLRRTCHLHHLHTASATLHSANPPTASQQAHNPPSQSSPTARPRARALLHAVLCVAHTCSIQPP